MLIVGVKFLCAWREQFVFYMDVGSRWWIVGLWPKSIWKFILLFFCFVLCLYKARMPCISGNKLPLVYCISNKKLYVFPPMDVAFLKVNHVNLFVCSFSLFFSFTLLHNYVCMTFLVSCIYCCCFCLFFITFITIMIVSFNHIHRECNVLWTVLLNMVFL